MLIAHSHVHIFVQFGSKVAWHLTTTIVIAVILGDVVNIMEDQAIPVQVLHGLQESHIKQHGSVERLVPTLNTHLISEYADAIKDEERLFEGLFLMYLPN